MSSSALSTNAPQPERPCFFNLRLALPPSFSRLASVPQYTPQIHPATLTHMHHSSWAWCRGVGGGRSTTTCYSSLDPEHMASENRD